MENIRINLKIRRLSEIRKIRRETDHIKVVVSWHEDNIHRTIMPKSLYLILST